MNREQIVRLYDGGYAAEYDRKFLLDPLAKPDTDAELALIGDFLKTHRSWLDVACGTGFFLRHFQQTERAGIDLSPAMLEQAREGNDGVTFRMHDFREPIAEWVDRWELVSCMWYAYGLVDTIADMERLIQNLWTWTSPDGTCFVPLADPSLITGVNIPLKPPTLNEGEVIVTGIMWSYVEDGGQKIHSHMLAPNLDFMIERFGAYFTDVKLVRYPPRFPGWAGRPALVATRKKSQSDATTR